MRDGPLAFWRRYLATLPPDHPHRRAEPRAFTFGDSPALADELAGLVVAGRKGATTSLPAEFAAEGLPLPSAGDLRIVTLADGTPVAVIETLEVRAVPFREVDAAFAAIEGEGDGSLAVWRKAHRAYFRRVGAALGGGFDEATVVLCQPFRVVWRGVAPAIPKGGDP